MAATDKTTLKGYFETGDIPTQSQFEQFIDSSFIGANFVFVYQKSDLPAAVGGVITLEANKTYYFTTAIDLTGDRLVCGANTTILGGSSENCSITSTGLVGQYLIDSDYTLPIRHITIKDVGLGISINTSGLGAQPIALDWTGVNFSGCAINLTCGDIDNFIFTKGAVLGGGVMQFLGSAGTIGIDNSLFVGTGAVDEKLIEVSASATITRRFRIILTSFVSFGATVGIDFNVSATVPVESFILDTVNFSGGGTYLSGVNYLDNRALFSKCKGITNTAEIGQYTVNGNAVPTTFLSAGVATKVLGSTSPNAINQKFSHSNNRLTYTGALTRSFDISAICTMSGGGNKEIGLYVAKNDITIPESETYATTNSGGRFENISIQHIITMDEGDYVELWAENATDTSSVIFESMNFIIRSIA